MIYSLEKLNTKELYHMQLLLKYVKSICQNYHERKFDGYNFKWKLICKLPRIATYDAKIRIFQYELLNNVICLNQKLFHFGTISEPKCLICNLYDETPQHLFYECIYRQHLCNHLQIYISGKIALPDLTPQSVVFGFTNVLDQNCIIVNHLIPIFKYNVYNSRANNTLSFQSLKYGISRIKYIEQTISENDLNKKRKILNKWKLIDNIF